MFSLRVSIQSIMCALNKQVVILRPSSRDVFEVGSLFSCK